MTSVLFFSKVVNHKIAIPFREHTKFKILNRMTYRSKKKKKTITMKMDVL